MVYIPLRRRHSSASYVACWRTVGTYSVDSDSAERDRHTACPDFSKSGNLRGAWGSLLALFMHPSSSASYVACIELKWRRIGWSIDTYCCQNYFPWYCRLVLAEFYRHPLIAPSPSRVPPLSSKNMDLRLGLFGLPPTRRNPRGLAMRRTALLSGYQCPRQSGSRAFPGISLRRKSISRPHESLR
jgi:hypothetical protein